MTARDKFHEFVKKRDRASCTYLAASFTLLLILLGLYFFYLTQAYYFSTESSYIVLRAGVSQFTFLPGFGRTVIQTDFKSEDLINNVIRENIDQGKIQGFWFLHAKEGYEVWGEQLASGLNSVARAKWLRLLGQSKFDIELFSQRVGDSINTVEPSVSISDLDQLARTKPEFFTSEMVRSLTALLSDRDIRVRISAGSILRQLAETKPRLFTPEIVRPLIALLVDKDYVMHSDVAISVLGQLAQSKPEVGRSLTTLLEDKDREVRSRAVFALEQLARIDPISFTPQFSKALIALLADDDSTVRSSAASAFGQLAQTRPEFFTPEIIQNLIKLLADKEYHVRAGAAATLGQLAQTRPEFFTADIVQSLIALLTDKESFVRSQAALALGQLGETRPELFTAEIVQFLAARLTDPGAFVPCSAAFALSQLAQTQPAFFTSKIVNSLTARLTDEDSGINSNVALALDELAQRNPGLFTPEITQSLFALLGNEDSVVRSRAAPALGGLTAHRPEILDRLLALIKNGKDSNGRNGASEALFVAAFREASQKNIIDDELEKLVKSPQPYLRAAASQALEMIAIGDFIEEARAHADRIDEIKSKLNDVESLGASLHEEHLQFAAQFALNEIGKIETKNRS